MTIASSDINSRRPIRLSPMQKRMVYLSLSFGAATARELADWSGVNVRTVYEIARKGFVNSDTRCRCKAAYKKCWL